MESKLQRCRSGPVVLSRKSNEKYLVIDNSSLMMNRLNHFQAATDLLDFFPEALRDGLNITWAHAVNSKAELEQALQGDAIMLETDIIVRGLGTTKQTSVPVHAHPPDIDSDITFEEWIDRVLQVPNKGIKLDFKCLEAVEPTLRAISQRKDKIHFPVLLNADIAVGPNSSRDPVDASKFIKTCNLIFAETIMSLGFTTSWKLGSKATYTWEMIFDMLRKVHELSQPVTFPIRAVFLLTSWKRFVWLLGLKQSFSISVWSSASDDVDMQGLLSLREYIGKGRVFYDLPEQQMAEFHRVLSIADRALVPRYISTPWNLDLWYVDQSDPSSGGDVFLSTTGVGFLSRVTNISDSQRVHSKQVLEVAKTVTNPFEVSGKVQFVDNNNGTGGYTQLRVIISCSKQQEVESSSNSSTTNDILSISISSSGSVLLQNLVSQISVDAALPSDQIYRFTIRNIGNGHTPKLEVTYEQNDMSPNDMMGSVNVSLPDNLAVTSAGNSLCVSFGRVGTSKDLFVENFAVKL